MCLMVKTLDDVVHPHSLVVLACLGCFGLAIV
jgi:hypothetical protein